MLLAWHVVVRLSWLCRQETEYCMRDCLWFFFKQKTAYEMRISDWSSDVCSSDLQAEEDQETDHVARDLVRFLDAGLDGVQQRAHRHGGEAEPPRAVADHGDHRPQQARRRVLRQRAGEDEAAAAFAAQGLQPVDLAAQPPHLPQAGDDDHAEGEGIGSAAWREKG